MTTTKERNFDNWMMAVDGEVERICGLFTEDLPDYCYRDWFDDGLSAKSAARRAVVVLGMRTE